LCEIRSRSSTLKSCSSNDGFVHDETRQRMDCSATSKLMTQAAIPPRDSRSGIIMSELHGRSLGTLQPDAVTIRIREAALEAAVEYSESDRSRELGGFLFGDILDQDRGIEVRYFLPAVDTRAGAASLTFTHDTWSAMTRSASERFPQAALLGWQHTHPGWGVFLSGYDLFIHRHFFAARWQIALVVDPVRQEFGFFQWRGDAIIDCGFVCLQDA
jgi:proteasome lid subunit RPN8/RPN11